MNNKNLHVLANILAAVESGGQVYSENRDWTAYAGAYTNSNEEHTCTLGPYQAYGDEAQELVQYIRDKYPKVFRECDKDFVLAQRFDEFERHGESWVSARWNPNGKEKAVLIKLLATDAGHEASEHVFQNRLNKYIARAKENGVTNIEGQMMWAEVQHLGGRSAVERVFKRFLSTSRYTCDDWLNALKQDQYDSYYSRNGVGSSKYWSRHVKCVEFIRKYADLTDSNSSEIKKEEVTMGVTAKDIIARAAHYVGYREKNHSWADMESFTADAGDGNFQKFQPLAGAGNGDQWCQFFVDGIFVEVTGSIVKAKEMLCQTHSGNYMTGYTPDGSNYFKYAGRWYTVPEPGDIIYFYSSSKGRIGHVGIVERVDASSKTVYTIEGNTNSDGFTTNGGMVARHSYSYASVGGTNRVSGFGRPKYGTGFQTLKKGMTGDAVKTLQSNLLLVGFADCVYYSANKNFADGEFGANTEKSVRMMQEANGLEVDGIYGTNSHALLSELVSAAKASSFSKSETEFLQAAKKVADAVRVDGWKYGNAPALPFVYPICKMTSCDRYIDQVLCYCGLRDVGNRDSAPLENYLLGKGCEKITSVSKIKAGDIIKLTTGHVFILGNKKGTQWERYDCGSDARIKSKQPFVEPVENFKCAFRLPFKTEKQKVVMLGQQHAMNFVPGLKIEADGIRGSETNRAMVKVLQTAANLDKWGNLEVDGVVGDKTKSAFSKSRYIKKGEKQYMVTAVEIICCCRGNYASVELPGSYGDGLTKALGGVTYLSGLDILKLIQ